MAGAAIKKPRADAKLLTLPEEQQQEIFAWLKVSSFEIVRGKIQEEYGFIFCQSALLLFSRKYWSRLELENRILKSKGCADDILELVEGDKANSIAPQCTSARSARIAFKRRTARRRKRPLF